ncbi:unnamed protein product [Litomosoides sigmodontis]|uniref:Uncharacterized protein n=1 Tax=Litomosoides sigmodontis TaxID=42156 RepID=A0A3P6V9E0_LITSI|nr:unnamed protein product [Litomosoides sigmodontis]
MMPRISVKQKESCLIHTMKARIKLFGLHYGLSLCCKPTQCLTYRFASGSNQKSRKELLPFEQRFHEKIFVKSKFMLEDT